MQPKLEQFLGIMNSDKYKYRVYMFLNYPRTFLSISYQVAVAILILTDMTLTIFMSRRADPTFSYAVIFWFDLAVAMVFCLELIANIWASTCLPKYRGWSGLLLLLIHPIYLLDMAVIGTCVATLVFDRRSASLAVGLRGFRMLHFFENRYHLWRMIGQVMWQQRYQLAVVIYFCIVWIFIIALLMYFIEAPFNDQFDTVANSLWFTIVTFSTVGYGDVAPVSTPGKIIGSIGLIIGVSIFAMPGGVVGAGLALKVEEEETTPLNLRQNLAATMVQYAWRVYWIKRRLERYPTSEHDRLLIRISPTKGLMRFVIRRGNNGTNGGGGGFRRASIFSGSDYSGSHHSAGSSSSNHRYFPPYVVQFVYLVRYYVAKRRFKFSMYLCDANTFYETYTQNTLNYSQIIRNMQTVVARIEEKLDDTQQMMKTVHDAEMDRLTSPPQQQQQPDKPPQDTDRDDTAKKPKHCKKCAQNSWTRLNRRRRILQQRRRRRRRQRNQNETTSATDIDPE